MHGVAWTGATKLVGQVAAWSSTIFLAHLLSAGDYGTIGMATLYIGLLQVLSEFGIGTAIVNRAEVRGNDAAQLNTVAVLTGIAGSLVLCATAPLVARFFHNPRLTPVLVVLSSTFTISSFRTVPLALLQRDLRFKRLAAYDGLQSVLLAAFSVALAAAGFGYWTLVAAAVLSALLSMGITVWRHPCGFAWPRRERIAGTVSMSTDLVVGRVAWYGYSNADFLMAGRLLGRDAAGAYTLAWTLANTAIDKIATTLLQVTPAVLARARDDLPALRMYSLRIPEILALTVCPATTGLALVAPEFVTGVLGDKWVSLTRALQLLSLYATVRALLPFFGQILVARGDQRFVARTNVVAALVMPPAFFLGSRWGITGIAATWLAIYPIFGMVVLRRALGGLGLGTARFARESLLPAAVGCGTMAVAVAAVRLALPPAWAPLGRLAIEVLVGAAVYAAVLALGFRARLRGLLTAWRELRRQG